MASATLELTSRFAAPHFSTSETQAKAHSPYGLPIVDHCANCKLRNSEGFCALSSPALKELDRMKHTTSYPEGALVFVEGQDARGVYILCQGRAKLLTTNRDGKTMILKIAEPGEVLGLHAVVSGEAHECTVETLQPAQLAFISREDFLRFIKSSGEACLNAAQHLSRDCQTAYELIRSIGLCHSVSEKLARLLLHWSVDAKITAGVEKMKLALTHEEMAQLIGSSRETVTRTLSDFRKKGFLEVNGSTLVFRNKSGLQRLAEG